MRVEVKGLFAGVGSLFLQFRFQGWNSGLSGWEKAPLPAGPPRRPQRVESVPGFLQGILTKNTVVTIVLI